MKRESMKKQEGKARRWRGRLGAVVVLAALFGLMAMTGSGAMAVTTPETGAAMPGLAAGGVLKADSGPPEGLDAAEWAQIQDLIKQDLPCDPSGSGGAGRLSAFSPLHQPTILLLP
jgi:hypothetical protein